MRDFLFSFNLSKVRSHQKDNNTMIPDIHYHNVNNGIFDHSDDIELDMIRNLTLRILFVN